MKDLILISAYCDTKEKENTLRGLSEDLNKIRDNFDIMIVSHSIIPNDISENVDFSIYDKKNDLLYDWDMRSKPWFSPGDVREILSIFTGKFNTHLAVWRLIIIGNSIAKNLGYKKVHHLEYDARISDFSEFLENSTLLNYQDSVIYHYKKGETVDSILLGSYQAYRLDTLDKTLLEFDEDKIKDMIRVSDSKSPEGMLEDLLKEGKRCVQKSSDVLFNGNNFMVSHSINKKIDIAWCLPYYDELTQNLCFVIWNIERREDPVEVLIVYNNEKTHKVVIDPQRWFTIDLDRYENAKELLVILDGKIRNHFKFDDYREEFKKISFRRSGSGR